MVIYKSLLEKNHLYSVDGIENNYKMSESGTEDISREELQEIPMKSVEDQYVPPWRAACDAWVTENVLDSPGENTPVYQLYNAYINDNPDDYMDIGQFGKVLRSRFPYRKRRRGKQGQQVYVYQDVALKKKTDLPEQVEKTKQQKSFESTFQNPPPLAGPAIVVGNSSGGLVFSSTSHTSEEEFGSLINSPIKREGSDSSSSLQVSPSHKRQKVSKEMGIPSLSDNSTLRFLSSFSPHFGSRKPVVPTTSPMRQGQNGYNDKQNYNKIFRNQTLEKLDRRQLNINSNKAEDIQWTKVKYFEGRSPVSKANNIFDKVVTDIGTSNITEKFQRNVNEANKSTQKNGLKARQNLISDVTFFKQSSDEINKIGVPSGSVAQRNSEVNLQEKYDSSDVKPEDEKYANTSLCRMAIGRRWIDTNLIDKTGVHTYADDICRAYVEDHPEDPLTYTSLALLIRGKYPGRRRKVSVSGGTKYIYQDIKLLRIQAEKSVAGTSFVSNQESVHIQDRPPALDSAPTKHRESLLNPSGFVLVPVLTNNISAFYPRNYRGPQQVFGTPLLAYSRPSSTLSFAKMNSLAQKPNKQNNSLTFESLLNDDDHGKVEFLEHKQHEYRDIHGKLPRTNNLRIPQNSEGVEYLTDKLPDVTVGDYLEKELLDINKLNTNINNYTLSIKFPSGKQEIAENIPSLTSSSSLKPSSHLTSLDKAVVMHDCDPNEKKSWDYGMRKSIGITNDESSSQSEKSHLGSKGKRNKGKRTKNRNPQKLGTVGQSDMEGENGIYSNNVIENLYNDQPEATERYNTQTTYNPQKEYDDSSSSTFSKSSSGSPTSTSPPCPAMFRLAEEIDTSTPHVAEAAFKSASQSPTASTSVDRENTKKQSPNNNPEFKKVLRSVILTARQIFSSPELLNETCIEMKLEKAVLGTNPAVQYSESVTTVPGASNADHFSCSVKPALMNLLQSSSGQISEILNHHQTCPGLGCSPECQVLRAAYIHMAIFRHKCSVWETFKNIVSKHSKQCRLVSCGMEFCQYVKHELHVSGTSVLPMQLFKERPTLEEEFRKCESIGTHDGDLHCRHMRFPSLPKKNSASKKRRDGEQPVDDVTMDTNLMFPDTPSGNSLAVPALKTINLIIGLFQASTKSS